MLVRANCVELKSAAQDVNIKQPQISWSYDTMSLEHAGEIRESNRGVQIFIGDCAGVALLVSHLKEFILWLLSWRTRRLDNETKELLNHKLRLENAALFADMLERLGCSEKEIKVLLFYDPIRLGLPGCSISFVDPTEGRRRK
jgi:hypothetical protein